MLQLDHYSLFYHYSQLSLYLHSRNSTCVGCFLCLSLLTFSLPNLFRQPNNPSSILRSTLLLFWDLNVELGSSGFGGKHFHLLSPPCCPCFLSPFSQYWELNLGPWARWTNGLPLIPVLCFWFLYFNNFRQWQEWDWTSWINWQSFGNFKDLRWRSPWWREKSWICML